MSRILHIVPGLAEQWSGIAVAARLIAKEQGAELVEAKDVVRETIEGFDEIWVHSTWSCCVWRACRLALSAGKRLVRMPHGNLDPVRLKYHGWKKWLVGPIERLFLRRCAKIVATCDAEKGWIKRYLDHSCPPVEVTDIKRFFDLKRVKRAEGGVLTQRRRVAECAEHDRELSSSDVVLHLLYLGRRHPLKGLEYLEAAVAELNSNPVNPVNPVQNSSTRSTRSTRPNISAHSAPLRLCAKIISSAFGDEKEKVWKWCDVLVLPTLSENFGLVVAEALERGKRVITTDGALAWGDGNDYGGRLIYLKGYRNGSSEERVRLLKDAIVSLANLER